MTVRPQLSLEPVHSSDIPTVADLDVAAFETDIVAVHINPRGTTTQARLANVKYRHGQMLADSEKRGLKFFKVVRQDTGEIAAYGIWGYHAPQKDPNEPADDCDEEFLAAFEKALGTTQQQFVGDRPHWYLKLICTHPKHQGLGAASPIIRWGLKQADEQGLPAYLEASPMAQPIYEKFGFRVVGQAVVNDAVSVPVMVREPQPSKSP
ncbi:acyl-CoA N-acyltransferase [Fimicolochytrium jonesii]|uniref:acyl-CoA N-acyltransferase n=1 Tax=Fimicolochytrium jonesii TaxID=1396493 RepID=UPI0022FEA7E3|nr:acyl-CoA N-acyltransferase [Fimicolochytrium jonesii]KAI8826702.1 acyl-CoA N-acyltransferase [Fimicolochytrium jonesii]